MVGKKLTNGRRFFEARPPRSECPTCNTLRDIWNSEYKVWMCRVCTKMGSDHTHLSPHIVAPKYPPLGAGVRRREL